MKPTISVALATYNEADHIKACLDAVAPWVDEIVIYDGQSTDRTVAIVKKFPKVKLLSGPNHPVFHLNKQAAIDACHSDWILQLDADEIVSPQLKEEILSTLTQTKLNGFWIPRRNFFLNRFLTKGGQYPDYTLRLYRRGTGRLPCRNVHEQAVVDGPTGHLHTDLLHFADKNFSRYLLRHDRYTSLLATEMKKQKILVNFSTFITYFFFKPVYQFCLDYFRHRGYVDGFPGFVFAYFSSLRFPISFIKLYEQSKSDSPQV